MQIKQPFLIALLALCVLIPSMPILSPTINRDSGVFLYIGDRILHGDTLYRNVWDHKPPMIYYINAFGLAISGGSRWGIWTLEFAAIFASVALSWLTLKQAFGYVPAMMATIIWSISFIMVLEGGNLAEEWALPLQFLTLYIFVQHEKFPSISWYKILLGFLMGIVFLLKPNLIGLSFVVICLMLLRHIQAQLWRIVWRDLSLVSLGVVGAVLPWILYFGWYAALDLMFDAAITYNMAYSNPSIDMRAIAGLSGLFRLVWSGILPLSLIGWIASWRLWRKDRIPSIRRRLIHVGLLSLPMELILTSISGHLYPHYYLSWLPGLALLVATLATRMLNIPAWKPFLNRWYSLILIVLALPLSNIIIYYNTRNTSFETTYNQVVTYVRNTTLNTDFVLVWGAETRINFASQRQSPTRFSYQTPLYTRGYDTANAISLFMRDIRQHQPQLIIDASQESDGFPSLQANTLEPNAFFDLRYGITTEIEQFYEYVAVHYTKTTEIGPDHWSMYWLNSTSHSPDNQLVIITRSYHDTFLAQ